MRSAVARGGGDVQQGDQGGAHAGELRVREGVQMDGVVSRVERDLKPCLRPGARVPAGLREVIEKGGDGEVAGDLATGGAAHAVADHVDAELRREGAGILVISANPTGVGAHGGD